VNSRIFTDSSYIWFLKFFTKIAIIGMAIFRLIAEIIYRVNPLKIQEFTLIIILVIFSQKWQFRLKNEYFEVSRNPANFWVKSLSSGDFWGKRLFRGEFRGESTQFRSEIAKFGENFVVNFHFGVKDFSARDGIETDSGFEPNRKRVFLEIFFLEVLTIILIWSNIKMVLSLNDYLLR